EILEDLLLEIIENGKTETRIRARTIADEIGLPPRSLAMIRSRLENIIAIGCRKAGLYQYGEAVPDIVKALDIFSSNTQFEVLMALSRIGNTGVMVQAFDKIHKYILVNERAINEIVNVFSGDRFELFHKMLFHESDYLVRIFLKAIDKETANALISDILIKAKTGDKETRLASIIAIGKSGNMKKIPVLTRAMRDTEWEIRAMAAKTLGILTGPAAISPLMKAARDREWWVRQNAVNSILAYPGCEMILASIIKSGDKYAYDSILYTLEKNNQKKLLPVIMEIWSNSPKKANLRLKIVS
ncbi:MAG: HEAT repeat domain-containing protein, partial [Treponema sp.]|nr:HEAT repeat domain-containing protein [Treponema sp.]